MTVPEDVILVIDGEPAQGPRVALGDPPVGDGGLDGRCELQETERVRHGRAGPTDPRRRSARG